MHARIKITLQSNIWNCTARQAYVGNINPVVLLSSLCFYCFRYLLSLEYGRNRYRSLIIPGDVHRVYHEQSKTAVIRKGLLVFVDRIIRLLRTFDSVMLYMYLDLINYLVA